MLTGLVETILLSAVAMEVGRGKVVGGGGGAGVGRGEGELVGGREEKKK